MMNTHLIKKISAIAIGTVIMFGVSACGDSKKNVDVGIDIERASQTEPLITTTEEITTEATTTEEVREYTIKDVNARNEETQKWKKKDWIAYATEMYNEAYEATWDYLESPIYKLDYNELITVDDLDYYESIYQNRIKGAAEEYYKVFAHSDASREKFESIMIEKDGKLYIHIESRDPDKYYRDTEIVSIDEYFTNQINFTARSYYYDSEYYDVEEEHINTQDRLFSLKYEGGKWKVYDFTLPD